MVAAVAAGVKVVLAVVVVVVSTAVSVSVELLVLLLAGAGAGAGAAVVVVVAMVLGIGFFTLCFENAMIPFWGAGGLSFLGYLVINGKELPCLGGVGLGGGVVM